MDSNYKHILIEITKLRDCCLSVCKWLLDSQQYSAPTSRHDTNRPCRNWHANRPAKNLGHASATGRGSRMPARASDQHVPTRPALYIPRLDCSFAGRREEKTFTIRGESAAASERRRYIVMDKSMHVSRAAYVSAFEHILYSARGSAITHVVSARVHPILLACAWGEHQYVSNIWLKRNKPLQLRTLVSRPTWRGVVFIGLRTRFVQRGRHAGCASCVVKNTICAAS